jgi:sugar transferase (PEP-CTERM system associated)
VVRLFNVYYPVRTLILILGETLIVCASFVAATFIRLGRDSVLVLGFENGIYKVLLITAVALLCFYYFDLYDAQRVPSAGETFFRLFVVLGLLSFVLAALGYLFPGFLLGGDVFLLGIAILTISLLMWRWAYYWLLAQPLLRERVYVMGTGERAQRLVQALRTRRDLGMEVVGWAGALGNGSMTREQLSSQLVALKEKKAVDHVIVALNDGRGKMPVRTLLELRMAGIKVDNATALLERISGKIEVLGLQPSWLIFSDGFRVSTHKVVVKRIISLGLSLVVLTISLPIMVLIAIAIRLDSKGPVLFRQERVGKGGKVFKLNKFRSMYVGSDSPGNHPPAQENDHRFTRVGRWLRKVHLDELPQLYNILRGDMYFVGPRPFVPSQEAEYAEKIQYYNLRWVVKPGATGWAQIKRGYCATIEENAEKLEYDLYYIKNMSIGLDLMIIFHTLKAIILGRGGR